MFRLRTAVLSLACVIILGSVACAQNAIEGRILPSDRLLDQYGLKLAWWGQAVMSPTNDRVRYVTLDEEVVVVQSDLGTVTAFDHNTGHKLWATQYGRPNVPSYPVAMNDELVVVTVGTEGFGVSKFSGRLLWRLRFGGDPSASPSLTAEQMFVGTVDGTVYAYNLKKILNFYQQGEDEKWSFLSINWRYKAGNVIVAPPVASNGTVSFSSRDGLLYSLDAKDHRLKYEIETDDPISAQLAVTDNLLYVVTEAYKAYCFDAERGGIRWEFVTGQPMHQTPRIVGEQLYLNSDTSNLYCVDRLAGAQMWMREDIGQFAAATNTFVYVSDKTGPVRLLSRANGSDLGSLPLKFYSIRPENDRTDRLFAVSPIGRVLCIHERGRDYPLYHKYPDRRPILPEITPEEEDAAAAPEEGAENQAPQGESETTN